MGLFSDTSGSSSPWGSSTRMQPWASQLMGGTSSPWGSMGGTQQGQLPGYGGIGSPYSTLQTQGSNPYQTMPQTAPPSGGVAPTGIIGDWFGGNTDSQKTTSTTTVNPWAPQGEELKKLYAAYGQNYADQMKLGPVGFDPASEVALNRMQRLAAGPNDLVNSAVGQVGDIASGRDHLTTGEGFGRIAGGPGISTGGFQSMYENPGVGTGKFNQLYDQTQGRGSLSRGIFNQMASGGLMDSNPYREQAIKQSMDDATNQINAQFTGGGRYTGRMGSSAYGDFAARQLGNIATNARMQGYDTDTANMMAAAQARSGEGLARQGLGLQAAQGVAGAQGQNAATRLAAIQGSTGVQNQNIQNQLAALQGQTGVQQGNIGNQLQAAGMADAMNELRYSDANHLAQVGGIREDQAQKERDFQAQQLRTWQGGIGNIPGSAGQSQTTQPGQSWWQKLLGIGGVVGGLGGLLGGL